MKKQVFNPFLPLREYIPDGEPHVFGDRVYLFGSHETEGGSEFCNLPYVVYSAPVDDLRDWTAKGVSYDPRQDPHWSPERRFAYAPDCVQGPDGRFYLYYCLEGYFGPISVAVSESPDGKYEYYGDVRGPDGAPLRRFVPFDPAVINDGGVIRLYYGTWYPFENMRTPETHERLDTVMSGMFGKSMEELHAEPGGVVGPVTVELADDMLTVVSGPRRIAPAVTTGTQWEQHPFFEGSSIRKVEDTYYFIYSSWLNHELCYATSRYPDRDFVYRGAIVSNGDIGLDGRAPEDRLNATGNTHGSIEKINGKWYVFYHRHTHLTRYSRQACAEPIEILPDGTIPQVEITSCGLNGGPLRDTGEYPAPICCNLTDGDMPHNEDRNNPRKTYPCVTSDGRDQFVRVTDGTWVGYKYFDFTGPGRLEVTCRGQASGKLTVHTAIDAPAMAEMAVTSSEEWTCMETLVPFERGKAALYLKFTGEGELELLSLKLEK